MIQSQLPMEMQFAHALGRVDPVRLNRTFQRSLRSHRCLLGDELLPSLATPYFLPNQLRSSVARGAERLASALEKISEARMSTDELDHLLPIDAELYHYAKLNTGYSGRQLVLRLDALLNVESGAFKVLEFNCGDPSGMGWNDGLINFFQDDIVDLEGLPAAWARGFDRLAPALAATVKVKYAEYLANTNRCRPLRPYLVFVCKRGSMIESDFRAMAANLCELGFDTAVADPGDFTIGERFCLRGRAVDIVYRDIVDDFLGPQASPGSQVLLQALVEEKICLLNPLAAAAGDLKNINALMCDAKYAHLFSDDELSAIGQHIPWTAPLSQANLPMAIDQKDELVLKPNLGFGGNGVLIGRELDLPSWRRELERGVKSDFTLQSFVDIPQATFPILDSDTLKFESRNVNVNFWVHNGKFTGAFARVSNQSIINVCQGGGLLPVCWV